MALAYFFGLRSIQTMRRTGLLHVVKTRLDPGNTVVTSRLNKQILLHYDHYLINLIILLGKFHIHVSRLNSFKLLLIRFER